MIRVTIPPTMAVTQHDTLGWVATAPSRTFEGLQGMGDTPELAITNLIRAVAVAQRLAEQAEHAPVVVGQRVRVFLADSLDGTDT